MGTQRDLGTSWMQTADDFEYKHRVSGGIRNECGRVNMVEYYAPAMKQNNETC
jgi:hypothetical protein